MVRDYFPGWGCRVRLFSCDTVNYLLKTNGEGEAETEGLIS